MTNTTDLEIEIKRLKMWTFIFVICTIVLFMYVIVFDEQFLSNQIKFNNNVLSYIDKQNEFNTLTIDQITEINDALNQNKKAGDVK